MKAKYFGGMDFDEWQRQFDVMWDYSLKKVNADCLDDTCRLYHCSATVEIYAHYVCLVSYSTLVAILDVKSATLYVRGRYSATTDQHICKFKKWLLSKGFYFLRVLQDYVNSRKVCGYTSPRGSAIYKVYANKVYMFFAHLDNPAPAIKLPTYPC